MVGMLKKSLVNVIQHPSFRKSLDTIKDCISTHRMLLLVGPCQVDYKGRAESKLGLGDRLLMIKEDGSVLVHRPTGYEPVNWQPSGSIIQTQLLRNGLEIRAIRPKHKEILKLIFNRVDLIVWLSLTDHSDFILHASESDMQQAVMSNPELVEPGFQPITYEKSVEPGFIDVFGRDQHGKLVVIEIKRKTGGRKAVLQLWKYIQSLSIKKTPHIRGILMSPRLAKGAQQLLESLGLEFKVLSPKKCAELLSAEKKKTLMSFFE